MKEDIQELLKPRIKVTNNWPFNDKWKVGEILTFFMAKDQDKVQYWYHHDKTHQNFIYSWFNQYPHLFKPLAWYEERDQSQMPEYVKEEGGVIHKVRYYDECGALWMEAFDGVIKTTWCVNEKVMPFFEPATETEYNQYLNQQKLENKI